MAYSFNRIYRELTGTEFDNRPVFAAPLLSPLRRPIEQSTVALFGTCGAQLASDPILKETQDNSFRLVPRTASAADVIVAHQTRVRKWAVEDLNVAYPLDRMKELEEEGVFERFAHTNISMVGSTRRYAELVQEIVPAIKQIYDSQGVDLVLVLPFCPACHRSAAIVARALEERGLPTLSLSVLLEASEEVKSPRTCFLDFPLGCPSGRPRQPEQQRNILRAAFQAAPSFTDEWRIHTLPFHWSSDQSRAWEAEVDDLYRHGGMGVIARHRAIQSAEPESNADSETGSAIRCNC